MPDWHTVWALAFVPFGIAVLVAPWWVWRRPWSRSRKLVATAFLLPPLLFLAPGLLYVLVLFVGGTVYLLTEQSVNRLLVIGTVVLAVVAVVVLARVLRGRTTRPGGRV